MTLTGPHPLEPLRSDELARAVRVLRDAGHLPERTDIIDLSLHEPSRDAVVGWTPGADAPPREVFAVTLQRSEGLTHETVVSLASEQVVSRRLVEGVQPAISSEEFDECGKIALADDRFLAGLARRDLDPGHMLVEAWGIGVFTPEEFAGRRIAWTLSFYRPEKDDNPYARPVEGLYALVDLGAMEVVQVLDVDETPLAPNGGDYLRERIGPLRDDLKPLEVHQPEGVSFTVDGHEVSWQRWRFVVGFSPREGLVLHNIRYVDGGRERPVCYRASFAELVIPYGDPRKPHSWTNAFDVGEYGIGPLTNSLTLGCDCLGHISYLNADVCHPITGEPRTIENAICLHEEDAGLLWKHFDADSGRTEVRRSRRFVVSSVVTVGNYEYAFYWYFYQDGSIEAEVRLTGIMLTSGIADGEEARYGTRVDEGVLAPYHQHFFSVRLHMTVDGPGNSVYEVDTEPVPTGPDNPEGNAFATRRTLLGSEQQAQRLMDPLKARHWVVENPHSRNRFGDPVGYKLVPGANVVPFAQPDSQILQRAAFMTRHLWVTPFDPAERYPAGDYPNQNPGPDGLPAWTRADRPVEDTDVVLWYTMGSHHIPRLEDWPVMPAEKIGFMLKPVGFFERNPALDVPPASGEGSCHA
jgi:primary-amine oxidase